MKSNIPSEIERLYRLGFAIHWLRPKSKIPVDSGWTSGPRADIEQLRARFKPSLNVGVRLGEPSKVAGGYLAIIDVDVKSSEVKHAKEAHAKLFELFPEVKHGPHLLSGRGNGSAHFYVRVAEPAQGDEVKARSSELVKVLMPSVTPSKREATELTDVQIADGWRLRPAWEISLLCHGRQAAVVGSIHPDTGEPYRWGKPVGSTGKDIPLLNGAHVVKGRLREEGGREHLRGPERASELKFEAVDVDALPLTKEQRAALVEGKDVSDRSAKVFELCIVLAAAKVPDITILSVMTDKATYLGQCAFDHRKTSNRQAAARWVEKYCLRKAKARANESPFDIEEVPSDRELEAKKKASNANRPKKEPGERTWPKGFTGAEEWESQVEFKWVNSRPFLKSTLANIVLILSHKLKRPDFVRLETFAQKIVWTCDTPWGIKAGTERSSGVADAVRIKAWFADEFKTEPSASMIDEALMLVSLNHEFHAVKEYLDGLEWDGEERLNTVFRDYLGSAMPEPYLSEVTRKFFAACVKRIFEPGTKFDHVIVLEGKQGVGKSTFGNILVGEKWFMDGLPNFQDKDAALNLVGTWICELGELATLYRSEENAAKSFITRAVDRIRPPYGQRWMEYRRSTVFLGTTDKRDYLTDAAGNRRYWPVKVKQCNFEALKEVRDQLWAEATWRYYFAPEPLYLQGEAAHQAKIVQELRRIEDEGDAMHDRFVSWLEEQKPDAQGRQVISMEHLFRSGPFAVLQYSRPNMVRAGAVLRELGFRKNHTLEGKRWVKENRKGSSTK